MQIMAILAVMLFWVAVCICSALVALIFGGITATVVTDVRLWSHNDF